MADSVDFELFLTLMGGQLVASDVPELLWPALHQKLNGEVYDAGEYFMMVKVIVGDDNDAEEGDEDGSFSWKVLVSKDEGISPADVNTVFLIDHAWSFVPEKARAQLAIPGVLERVGQLLDLNKETVDSNMSSEVMKTIWKFCQYYEIWSKTEDGEHQPMPVWYLMDELGTRIQHLDEPSFKLAPIFYPPHGLAYTVMWPIKELESGDEVTRDYANGHQTSRDAHLLPWQPKDMTAHDCRYKELGAEYFQAHYEDETLPDLDQKFPPLQKDTILKIYTDMDLVKNYVTDARYEQTDSIEEADILWFLKHYKDFKRLNHSWPRKFINQFPCEFVLTSKNLLAVTCRKKEGNNIDLETLDRGPSWLPVTYILQQELTELVSYYQQREEKGLDNLWICKPWNLAQGMDMHITDDLNYIIRLADSAPKVACKYISDPVLFNIDDIGPVKFDIRYVVCLSSVKPLTLHAYSVFWLRFANKPYSLDNFDDYEKHFTVMNYRGEAPLRQLNYDEFIPLFDQQYPDYPWIEVQKQIFSMFGEIFELAASEAPPCGLCPYPQSRALYAIDFMLSWKRTSTGSRDRMQPMVCEVNFNPDNTRGCKYHPQFYNHMFNLMFRGEEENFSKIL